MSQLSFGLSVAVIGILVVFLGLIILILFLKLFEVLFKERKKEVSKAEAQAPIDALPVSPAPEQAIAPEVIAAITAAVSAVWQEDTGFIVRRVRRIHSAPAWNRAGRDDQVYSRL